MKKFISLCALSFFASTIFAADIRQGLVSYWPLESNNGGIVSDLAFGNNLNVNGSPTVVGGTNGSAFQFNATTDYLLLAHSTNNVTNGLPIYNGTNGAYTVTFWVKLPAPPASTGDKTIFGERGSANPIFFLGLRNASTDNGSRTKLDVFVRNNAGGTTPPINHRKSTAVVFDNTWHHVAWVDNKGVAKLYIDGTNDLTDFNYNPNSPVGGYSIDRTAIGALVQNNGTVSQVFTNGVVDEVAIWERDLSQAEVAFVKTNGLANIITPDSLPFISVLSTNVTNFAGTTVTLNPRAIGNPPFTNQWTRDGSDLGVNDNVLVLSNVTTNESGTYTFSATNVNGAASQEIHLTVLPDPSVSVQPVGAALFTQSSWTFTVEGAGTSPFFYQWYKGNSEITNATANSLVLTNLQLVDSGDYYAIVSNSFGSATSQVATLIVTQRPAPPSSLSIDFDDRGTNTLTESGFQSFLLSGLDGQTQSATTRLFGGVEVTLAGTGGLFVDDRIRTTPTNFANFTHEKLLRDVIFAVETSASSVRGLDLTVDYLLPNKLYSVTIWSFDTSNSGRSADWSVNGTTVTNNYTFNGGVMPLSNNDYQFSADVLSDVNGRLLISGRRNLNSGANTVAVFLNAVKIEIPSIKIKSVEIIGSTVRLTFFTPEPALTYQIQQLSDLSNSNWSNVSGVTFTQTGDYTIQAEFAYPGGDAQFYNVSRSGE